MESLRKASRTCPAAFVYMAVATISVLYTWYNLKISNSNFYLIGGLVAIAIMTLLLVYLCSVGLRDFANLIVIVMVIWNCYALYNIREYTVASVANALAQPIQTAPTQLQAAMSGPVN